jgi:hypothetical protein
VAVRIGLVLSVLVVVAAIGYVYFATRDFRYPDLVYIPVYLGVAGATVALAIIWLSVLVVRLLGRRRLPS